MVDSDLIRYYKGKYKVRKLTKQSAQRTAIYEFLERVYYLGKPFAFLMPLDVLATPFRHELYRKHGVDIIFYDARINFLKHKKGNWFNSCWICWQFLPEKIIFEELNKR